MPTYEFLHKETNEHIEKWFSSYIQKDEWLEENTEWSQTMTRAPGIVSGISGSGQNKVPSGFNEVLSKVAEAHPTSVVADRHGRKGIKEAKTSQIVKKHLG